MNGKGIVSASTTFAKCKACRYYNPTFSAFKGQSQDFIDAYEASARALLKVDEDVTYGGASVAYQIRHNPAYPKQPNNEDTLKSAAAHGIPMDFFSYHSITTSPGADQIEVCLACQPQANLPDLPCCSHNVWRE